MLDEMLVQLRHAGDLRAVERRTIGIDQAQQLVAVRARHDQHQVDLTRTIQLVARRLERRHHGFTRFTGQRVLGFVDDQRQRCLGGFMQGPQRFGQGQAIDASDLAGVDLQCAGNADVFQPGLACNLRQHTELVRQGTPNGIRHQQGRVTPLVRPQVDVNHDDALGLQHRPQVALQEGGLAGTARCGQEQAIVCITEQRLALQGLSQALRQCGARVVNHVYPTLSTKK